MTRIRRAGTKLAPGNAVGDVPTWNGVQYLPAQPLVPPGSPTPAFPPGDTLIFNTINNTFMPASSFPRPPGASQIFEVDSFSALPDGSLIQTWPDVSGHGLDISNGGGAARPTLKTDADGVRAVVGDGAANVLRRLGMTAVNTFDLTVFVVQRHTFFSSTKIPWSLGRAATLSNAVGCARGLISAASICHGAQANNLGGAITHSGGGVRQDDAAGVNTAGQYAARRAYAFTWRNIGLTANPRWCQTAFLGDVCASIALDVSPPANNFSFTDITIMAENNGGGAPTLFADTELTYFSYYVSGNSSAISLRAIWIELERLRAKYQAL